MTQIPSTSSQAITSDQLPYTFTFASHQLKDISDCLDEHGFAVARQVIDTVYVAELCDAIEAVSDPFANLGPGQTRIRHGFCDYAPSILKLLDNEAWLTIQRHLHGTDELTVHRCASILKNVGSSPVPWHTDWMGYMTGEPMNASAFLNTGEHPSGSWFYLDGTHPSRAGLAIIPGSHRIDWQGPEGYEFTKGRASFYPKGDEPSHCKNLDVPGAVALLTDPGDMILFAARTYHYATEHNGKRSRRSCSLGLRSGRGEYNVPWELPESTRFLKNCVPDRYKPYLERYTGYTNWTRKQNSADATAAM